MAVNLAFCLLVLVALLGPWLLEDRLAGPEPAATAAQMLGLAGAFLFFGLALPPAARAFWGPCLVTLGFALQFLFYQVLLGERRGPRAALALRTSQSGWILLAMGLKGPWPVIGGFNLLAQQAFVTLPLALLLRRRGPRPRVLFLLLALALAGCIPFSGFSAYFQIFIPLMGVKAAITSLHDKLFTEAAFLGTLVIFSLLYQTCALGYLVWREWKDGGPEGAVPGRLATGASWACLALSLAWGLNAGRVARGIGLLVGRLGLGF